MLPPSSRTKHNVLSFVTAETVRVAQGILRDEGIDCVVLKGPHLAYTIYKKPQDRTWCDLDLLVRPADFKKAFSYLQGRGFRKVVEYPHRLATAKAYKNMNLISPLGLVLELHHALSSHERYPVDIDLLIREAEPYSILDVEARGLKPEHLLLHLCIHMTGGYLLHERKHLEDIALLVQRRAMDWNEFLFLADKAGCRAVSYYVLLAAQRQMKAPVPETVLSRLRPGRMRAAWLGRFLDPDRLPIYIRSHHSYATARLFISLPLVDRVRDWFSVSWRYFRIRVLDVYYSLSSSTPNQPLL